MPEVNQEEEQVEHHSLPEGKAEATLPEITQGPKSERDGQDEVIEPHHEHVIIDKGKAEETQGPFSRIDRANKVHKSQGKADHVQAEEDLFGSQRGEDAHQRSQAGVGKPIGERLQAQVVYFLEIEGRVGELAEDLGVIEVARAILGGDVLKKPDWNEVKQDEDGD